MQQLQTGHISMTETREVALAAPDRPIHSAGDVHEKD